MIPRPSKISARTAWDINERHRSPSHGFVGASLVGRFSGSPRRVVIRETLIPLSFSRSVIPLLDRDERAHIHARVPNVCVCVYISLFELSSLCPLVTRCPRDSVQFVSVLSPDSLFFSLSSPLASYPTLLALPARRARAKEPTVSRETRAT